MINSHCEAHYTSAILLKSYPGLTGLSTIDYEASNNDFLASVG